MPAKSAFVFLVAIVLIVAPALAAPYSWNDPFGGDFEDGGKWTPSGPPTPDDTATFNVAGAGPYTVTASAATSARRLTSINIGNNDVTFDLGGTTLNIGNDSGNATNSYGLTATDHAKITVHNGTLLTDRDRLGGFNAGANTAEAVIEGAGAVWSNRAQFFVGGGPGSTGLLTVRDGATLQTYQTLLGFSGGNATVLVTDPGTQWIGHSASGKGTITITNQAAASFDGYFRAGASTTVDNGATLTGTDGAYLGAMDPGSNFYIDGAGTKVTTDGYFSANEGGNATVSGGAQLSNYYALIGQYRAPGTVLVTGAGTSWTSSGYLSVGSISGSEYGTGYITVADGASMKSDSAMLARGGEAQVTVTGVGSSFVTNGVSIGDTLNSRAGHGTLEINQGATAKLVSLYAGERGSGTVVIANAGSQLTVDNAVVVGDQSGVGSLIVQSGGAYALGVATSTTKPLSPSLTVGNAAAAQGSVTVDGAGSHLQTAGLKVGNSGTGDFAVRNGGHVDQATGDTQIAALAGSHGQITVADLNSAFASMGHVYVGGSATSAGGAGNLTVGDGGVVVAQQGVVVYATGTANIESGGLLVADVDNYGYFHNNGAIEGDFHNRSGATLHGSGSILGNLTLDPGSIFDPGNSPGYQYVNANVNWSGGSLFNMQINSTVWDDVQGLGWDALLVHGALNLLASPDGRIWIVLESLELDDSTGNVFNFDPSQPHAWQFVLAEGGVAGFRPDLFAINALGFNGGAYQSHFFVSQSGNDLYLNYSVAAIPEPGTLALLGLGSGILLWARRRRRGG